MSERRQVYRERLEQALSHLQRQPVVDAGGYHMDLPTMDFAIRLEGFVLDELDKHDERDEKQTLSRWAHRQEHRDE